MHKITPLFAIPFVLLLVHCSDTQSVDCGAGQAVGEDGRCVDIQCEGGDIQGTRCICPDDQVLDAGRCTSDPCIGKTCDDENECTSDTCDEQGVCVSENVPDDTDCDAGDGVCIGGSCVQDTLCAGVDCSSQNECVGNGACNLGDGACIPGDNKPVDTACTEDSGSFCDGAGACVGCNRTDQCSPDGNECTTTLCSEDTNDCETSNREGECDFNSGDGVCVGGTCEAAPCDLAACQDANDCTTATCPPEASVCAVENVDARIACEGQTGVCDGAGNCVDCVVNGDCQEDNQCKTVRCEGNSCVSSNLADGTLCDPGDDSGVCFGGTCTDAQECNTEGVQGAMNQGGGPHYFACSGRTKVLTPAGPVDPRFTVESVQVILDGLGNLILDGGNNVAVNPTGVVVVRAGAEATLRNIDITGGKASDGGGIAVQGLLTLENCAVYSNEATDDGGGIAITASGTATLIKSTVETNLAGDAGGGILVNGKLTLDKSTLQNNVAAGHGGAVASGANSETDILNNSRIYKNRAGDSGGGIRIFRSSLTVADSTIDENKTTAVGGGISSYGDNTGTTTVEVLRSTISGNIADGRGGGVESQWTRNTLTIAESAIVGNDSTANGGGGLYVQDGATAHITNCTIAENHSASGGAGLLVNDSNTRVDITHCTFRNNTTDSNGGAIALTSGGQATIQNSIVADTCNVPLTTLGGNIQSTADDCGFSLATADENVLPADLKLGALGLNGGATLNYLPGAGSRAIGFAECVAGVTAEQRGINSRPQPQGSLCDCGSVETP